MEEHKSLRRIPLGILAGFSVLVLATGSATAWWVWRATAPAKPPAPAKVEASPSSPDIQVPTTPPIASTTPTPKPSATVAQKEQTVQVYWLKDTGSRLELAPDRVTLNAANQPSAVLEAAIAKLLAGPTEKTVLTTIPEKTELRSVSVKPDGVHVDLSSNFTSGGGSASMIGRVAQITYTATSLEPKAKVWISVNGKPLEVLGGEGLMLDQPFTRQSFEKDFTL